MSDINSIATGAVTNYQRALMTVANNIANVDSEGTRQEVTLWKILQRNLENHFLERGQG